MKVIEKINGFGDTQIFEVIKSRKELASWLRDMLFESVYWEHATGIFCKYDVDTTIHIEYKTGETAYIAAGEQVKRPNVANISRVYSSDGSTVVLYGKFEILQDEYHGGWDAREVN